MSTAIQVIKQKSEDFLARAKGIRKIRTQADRELVAVLLVTNGELQKEIERVFRPMKQKARAAWQEVVDQEKEQMEPLKREEETCRFMQRTDYAEQEYIRVEREMKAREEVQRKALEERERAVAALKEAGDKQEAKALAAAPLAVAPVEIANKATNIEGVTFREEVRFQIEDPMLVPREYLIVDETAIRRVANALKAKTSIPGVRVWLEKVPVRIGARSVKWQERQ